MILKTAGLHAGLVWAERYHPLVPPVQWAGRQTSRGTVGLVTVAVPGILGWPKNRDLWVRVVLTQSAAAGWWGRAGQQRE